VTKRGSNFYFGPGMYFQTGQVIFVPEWPKGEFVSILVLFCVWTKSLMFKDAINRDSTFRVMSRNSSSLSAVRTMCHPFRTPICLLLHPSGRRVIPSGLQTVQHYPSGRRAPSVRTPTLYQEASVPACIRPDVSVVRPDAYQFSNGSLILSKFQEREDQSTVRTCVSIRQESQFKFDRPEV
jgi:hypothetical protein